MCTPGMHTVDGHSQYALPGVRIADDHHKSKCWCVHYIYTHIVGFHLCVVDFHKQYI